MTNYDCSVRKTIKIFFVSALLFLFVGKLVAQVVEFSITTHASKSFEQGKISVSITKGEVLHIFMLYTEVPWKGGSKITESGIISDKEYTFKNLAEGKYVVIVSDAKRENITCKYVSVSTSGE